MMHKDTFVIVILVFLVPLAGVTPVYPALPAAEQAALWSTLKEAKSKNGTNALGRWRVLEDISVIKRTDGVSKRAAALATVVNYDNGERFIIGDDQVAVVLARTAEKKGLKEQELVKLRERFGKHGGMLTEEYEQAKKRSKKFLTRGVDLSLLIEKYLANGRGDIPNAAESFASRRAYNAVVISKENPAFDDIADTILRNKPLILQEAGSDAILICIGFLNKDGIPYVITADPEKIELEDVSNADFILGQGEMARRAREAAKGFDNQFGLAKRDRKVPLAGEIPAGVEIVSWRQGAYKSFSVDFMITEQSVERTFFPRPLFSWFPKNF